MKLKALLALLMISLFACSVQAQKTVLGKAEKKYERYAYIDAAGIYEQLVKKGYGNEKVFRELGNAYYFNSQFDKAQTAYAKLFEINPNQEAEVLFRFAQSLKSAGNYEDAAAIMKRFAEKAPNDRRAVLFQASGGVVKTLNKNVKVHVEDAGINSGHADYGGAIFGNRFVFSTARDTGGFVKRRHSWNNKAFTNLYAAEISNDLNVPLGKPERFSKSLASKFHESSAVFTKDGKTVYFTRNNFYKGHKGKSRSGVVLLKLYRARLVNGKWERITELPFNSNDYSTAHPALSADEKTLYFASDMPKGYGQSDLYRVAVQANGTYGKPENLGPEINTPGRETFPFVDDNQRLYFASDGRPGFGGLDLFSANGKDGHFGTVENLGIPMNSPADDFAIMVGPQKGTGFFSSNREGGKGQDDIYRFSEIGQPECERGLEGVVSDLETGQPIDSTRVIQYDKEMKMIRATVANKDGRYNFDVLPCGTDYFIRAEKTGYEPYEVFYRTPDTTGTDHLPLKLRTSALKFKVGTDLALVLDIPLIPFDLGKWDIRADAEYGLEKIVTVMNQFPAMKIDVRSHTDSRQSHQYNQELSDKRARSTVEWLVKKGISPERLTGRGYGETKLVNHCADGVPCTEAEHQMNRRSQFIVTAI